MRRGESCRGFRIQIERRGMEYSQHLCIPKWVSIFRGLTGLDHNEGVCAGVDRVLFPTNIICCVIDAESLDRKNLVADDTDPIAVFIREAIVELHIRFPTQHPHKKVLAKFLEKVLQGLWLSCIHDVKQELTFFAGSSELSCRKFRILRGEFREGEM